MLALILANKFVEAICIVVVSQSYKDRLNL